MKHLAAPGVLIITMKISAAVMGLVVSSGLVGCVAPLLPEPPPRARTVEAPAAVAPDTQVFVYPTRSQTPEQQDRDKYECNAWAVKQTGFDPSLPVVAPHQRVRVVSVAPGSDVLAGAATGAIIGAAVSRPREAGQGAVVGAIAGTILGAASDQARQQQVAAINQRAEREAAASSLDARAVNFRRAISACLEGRGYTVK